MTKPSFNLKSFVSNSSLFSFLSSLFWWKKKKNVTRKINLVTPSFIELNKGCDTIKSQLNQLSNEVYSYRNTELKERKPSVSEASIILKKNEGLMILWRKGVLTDDQVQIIADSDEKVLDLSLFDLSDNQLEILSHFKWEEIIFWFKKITDKLAEIFSKYQVGCLNLRDLLKISDYQLEELLKIKWKKLNLRDLNLTRIQKTMVLNYKWKLINRVYTAWEEMNKKIIEHQMELKKQREEKRRVRSVAYTSFQYS